MRGLLQKILRQIHRLFASRLWLLHYADFIMRN